LKRKQNEIDIIQPNKKDYDSIFKPHNTDTAYLLGCLLYLFTHWQRCPSYAGIRLTCCPGKFGKKRLKRQITRYELE
jgi:hypothetical protein